jgi:hypothetical protein
MMCSAFLFIWNAHFLDLWIQWTKTGSNFRSGWWNLLLPLETDCLRLNPLKRSITRLNLGSCKAFNQKMEFKLRLCIQKGNPALANWRMNFLAFMVNADGSFFRSCLISENRAGHPLRIIDGSISKWNGIKTPKMQCNTCCSKSA